MGTPAAALLIGPLVASTLLGWCLIGDISEPGGDQPILAVQVSSDSTVVLGLAGAVVAAEVLWQLWALRRAGAIHRRSLWILLPPVYLGALLALAMRVLSARPVGANIGGGMMILFGPFVGLGLVLWAWWGWRSIVVVGGRR